jgi:hypothetical protein
MQFHAVWAYNTESTVIVMIVSVNLQVAALVLLSQDWHRIPLAVLLVGCGIGLAGVTAFLAAQVIKAMGPDDRDPFVAFSKAAVVFYVGMLIVLEILGAGMSIASIWGVIF